MSAKIEFFKTSGSGNDFVIVDNREGLVTPGEAPLFARRICCRRESVGADGLILLLDSNRVDFKWGFYNADGSEAEMCGNGGRCAARVANMLGMAEDEMVFETVAGDIRASVNGSNVKLEMVRPRDLRLDYELMVDGRPLTVSSLNTGVPHVILWVEDLERVDVEELGRQIRYHPEYQPAGANVNFVRVQGDDQLAIRTYERGVEGETLACGTGSVAAALLGGISGRVSSPAGLKTRGGETLLVHFEVDGEQFREVFLQGDARIIYRGDLWQEALEVKDV